MKGTKGMQSEWARWIAGMVRRIRVKSGKKAAVSRVFCIPNTTLLAVSITADGEEFGMYFNMPSMFADDPDDVVEAVMLEFGTCGLIPKEKQGEKRLEADG